MLLPISKHLNESVQKIISNISESFFAISLQIISTTNSQINITVDVIDGMDIEQLFSQNFTDNVKIDVRLTPKDYMLLVNNHKDLIGVVRFTYIDKDSSEIDVTKAPIVYKFKCIINDPVDLTKKYHASVFQAVNEQMEYEGQHAILVPATIQLLDETIYYLRKRKINFILTEATVAQTIQYASNLFGIKKLHLETPDNTEARRHIIISPPKDFSDIFDFIQERYGVYYKGLEYFYTGDILYIYPPYELSPNHLTTMHVYKVPTGQFAGLSGYHYYDNSDLKFISNSKIETQNLTETGVENDGNSVMFIRADTVIDEARTVTNEAGGKLKKDNMITVDMSSEQTMTSDTISVAYGEATTNLFKQTSRMVKNNATMVVLQWSHAIPFAVMPGQKTVYHFDDEDGMYNCKTGRCEGIYYKIDKVARVKHQIYSCVATVILRIDATK